MSSNFSAGASVLLHQYSGVVWIYNTPSSITTSLYPLPALQLLHHPHADLPFLHPLLQSLLQHLITTKSRPLHLIHQPPEIVQRRVPETPIPVLASLGSGFRKQRSVRFEVAVQLEGCPAERIKFLLDIPDFRVVAGAYALTSGDVVRISPSNLCSGGFGSSDFECSRDVGAGVVGVGGEGLRVVDEAEDPVFDDETGVGEGSGVLGREGEGVGGDEGGEFGFAVFAVGGEEGGEVGDEGGYVPGWSRWVSGLWRSGKMGWWEDGEVRSRDDTVGIGYLTSRWRSRVGTRKTRR